MKRWRKKIIPSYHRSDGIICSEGERRNYENHKRRIYSSSDFISSSKSGTLQSRLNRLPLKFILAGIRGPDSWTGSEWTDLVRGYLHSSLILVSYKTATWLAYAYFYFLEWNRRCKMRLTASRIIFSAIVILFNFAVLWVSHSYWVIFMSHMYESYKRLLVPQMSWWLSTPSSPTWCRNRKVFKKHFFNQINLHWS